MGSKRLTVEEKLDAADKTVAVLKEKVKDFYNGEATSVIAKQLESIKAREHENRRKQDLMELRNAELKKYSHTLEVEVEKRTAAIKTILNNVKFGFLVIDRSLKVKEEPTRSCYKLFNTDKIENKTLPEILCMNKAKAELFSLMIDQVFEDILPEELSLEQIPGRFKMPGGYVLCLEGSLIRDSEGAVEGVLFSVSDITALEDAQLESLIHQALLLMLRQREAFTLFLQDAKHQMQVAKKKLATAKGRGDEQVLARRVLHTIKGNTASYGLDPFVEKIHKLEENAIITYEDIKTVENMWREFLKKHYEILQIDYDQVQNEAFELSPDQVQDLKEIVGTVKGEASGQLRSWTAKVLQKRAGTLLGPIHEFVQKLAGRLGKQVNLTVEGAETMVHAETMIPIFRNLPHLIRNSIDHGIEPPEGRQGKPANGQLKISISEHPDCYQLDVSDDGRGIEVDTLSERAVNAKMLTTTELNEIPPDKRVELIFLDGLSSAEQTTDISGRGVGMSAVKEAVLGANGSIMIRSKPGEGTLICVIIPKPELFHKHQDEGHISSLPLKKAS